MTDIVVLDALPLNPGDLDWGPLAALGNLRMYEHTSPGEVAERIAGAGVVYTNKVRLDRAAFAAASDLRLVSVIATGYDVVDVDAAREHGVTVCNVPGYSTPSTAQTAIALLLELAYRVGAHADAVRAGEWTRRNTWSFRDHPLVELADKTLVIVGLGAIGGRVAQIGAALGMRVVAAQFPGRPSGGSSPYPRLPLDDAFAIADVVSLHCPLTPATRGLVSASRLARMKPGAFLVNTSRGPLVDEAALAEALHAGRLGGYAADVLAVEPPPAEHPLLRAPNCLITPHLAWASRESRQRLLDASVENLRAFLAGTPQNVVS